MSGEKLSIKEYTRFVAGKLEPDNEITDEEIDNLMFSFGFKYNQEV